MSNKGLLTKLAESRLATQANVRAENKKLITKWQKSGLLAGLKDEQKQGNLARLLENQSEQLLNEANSMSSGNVEGFATVVFPMVRRIFGDMIAEQIVSVQTMSMPTGIVFFLDFVYDSTKLNNAAGTSIYGGGVIGSGIMNGVNLEGANATRGFQLGNEGYSSPITRKESITYAAALADGVIMERAWTNGGAGAKTVAQIIANADQADVMFNVNLLNDVSAALSMYRRYTIQLSAADFALLNLRSAVAITVCADAAPAVAQLFLAAGSGTAMVHELTQIDSSTRRIHIVMRALVADVANLTIVVGNECALEYPIVDTWAAGATGYGTVVADDWGFEGPSDRAETLGFQDMPEINIILNHTNMETKTRKLKARWTPELTYMLQAYQNIDAEVELSGILADHVEREIDNEILYDLVGGATGGVYYWDRRPGKFTNRTTGAELTAPPDYTGIVSAWYETLIETCNDLSAQMFRKTLIGGANILVMGPEMGALFEAVNGFRSNAGSVDAYAGDAGVTKLGSITKKWDIFISPYFPRNIILLARKGGSNFDAGYIYAPFVPLTLTPVIYEPTALTPVRGIMTMYAKKMVRPDFFSLVYVKNMFYGN
jgi:hypothetical protein